MKTCEFCNGIKMLTVYIFSSPNLCLPFFSGVYYFTLTHTLSYSHELTIRNISIYIQNISYTEKKIGTESTKFSKYG